MSWSRDQSTGLSQTRANKRHLSLPTGNSLNIYYLTLEKNISAKVFILLPLSILAKISLQPVCISLMWDNPLPKDSILGGFGKQRDGAGARPNLSTHCPSIAVHPETAHPSGDL